ncbi:helix-turn-helix domain-containing protein [Conexibacter sp. JD483]|uniref:GlxA family transcriptional regulator n=1 Tax=unclassified Conexibacter TaxID=2627773 RepID=UPI002727FFD0|nr:MULTISPECIES: helix-turn-helix domain-containing protein [unclassified Conexibacter]MDO8185485.1 helix-turn-helix domain-containing protein [Conexibacter sp. CPCC 205706]MDO8197328.1 helix-turn-helix domain-containing protein [Conexibacter sp. CPCC 205762]MDR9371092.1 helix-turn-helix domain-containing protein [Conexibacter sp. JD483]
MEAHLVAVLALDGVIASDLATPLDLFGRVRLSDGRAAYRTIVCSPRASVTAGRGLFTIRAPHRLDALARADTIVVPGLEDPLQPTPPAVLAALRAAAARGTRIASICVGAFTLAETGLLDGQRATTHWLGAEELARRHPAVAVDPNVLYVDNGQLLTSAGAAAGLDLCLHIVRRDHGAAVAADAARCAVTPPERDGGQAQYIVHPPPAPDSVALGPLLEWIERNCHRELTLEQIAAQAPMSTRTLNRRFREQTGTTPLRWLHRARLRRAQHLLETTAEPVELVAARVGFGSATSFRDRFRAHVGTSPQAYRRAFRAPSGSIRTIEHPPAGSRSTSTADPEETQFR